MRPTYFVGIIAGLLVGCQLTHPSTSPDYRAMRQELHRIHQRDQLIRASIMAVGMDSPAAVPLFQQMHATDSVNQVYVRHLLATTGWPPRAGRRAARWATPRRAPCTWSCSTRAAP